MTEYQYTKTPVAADSLAQEINTSAITIALDNITVFGSELTIYFKAAISNDEKTILDGIVDNHNGEPLPQNTSDPVMVTEPISISSQPPFAEPLYTTKWSGIPEVITLVKNEITSIDFLMTEERYVFGGEACVENVEFGDYITAEVYDKDGVIPEGYRSATCEAWPIVVQYAGDHFWLLRENESKYTKMVINTAPLAGQVSAGLYLRINYHAINVGIDRRAVLNYFLTKKVV